MTWMHIQHVKGMEYECGYCNRSVAPSYGYPEQDGVRKIYICPKCENPSYFNGESQYPGVPFGNDVEYIDDDKIKSLYEEARNCCSTNSYTASILCCRKILMHIAVDKGAETGKKFIHYVQYLVDQHYAPPGSEDWVDHIRRKGNEANHEIVIMDKKDAKELLSFIEMLLKYIYEFPARIKQNNSE